MWLRSILDRRGRKRPPESRKLRPTRLGIEVLEDRTVPSGLHGAEVVSHDPNDWPMFGHDAAGTRYNSAEHLLSPDTVGSLEVKWTYPTDGPVVGTPAVVKDVVYAADDTGSVYALTRDGGLKWRTTLNIPSLLSAKIFVSPLVTNRTVIIGDMAGQIHGLDVDTGHARWTTRPPNPGPVFGEQHPFQMIMGAGTMVGDYVAFGVSSLENMLGPLSDPNYPGFTFRGNVVLIDPSDGRIVWQTFFVDEPTLQPDDGDPSTPPQYGPSGATVWGSPAYDPASKTIFVGTGQNYDQPTTSTSDALIALDARTGAIKWVSQETPNDTWNLRFGPPDENDLDIGDSPQLYRLNGHLVVAAGQKSGVFHVVDAATGEAITPPQQFLPSGGLGGFHTDSAVANGVNYAPGNYWAFVLEAPVESDAGAVFAISGDGSTQLWKFDTEAPIIGGVAVANGVIYVQDTGGTFYAIDAASGTELAEVTTGSGMSSPAISRGQIYLGDGGISSFSDFFVEQPPGSIMALGLADLVRVESVTVNDGSAQRSMVTNLAVTFSGPVTLDASAFQLRRHDSLRVGLNVAASVVNGKTVAVLTFTGSDLVGGSLADGNSKLSIRGDRIHDAAGRELDGNGNGTAGGNHRDAFFRPHRDVDARGLLRLLTTLGREEGQPGPLDPFDHDGDGDVDLPDSLAFLGRLGARLRP